MPIPQYMNKGSRGPLVAVLQAFLFGTGDAEADIVPGNYDERTVAAVRRLQITELLTNKYDGDGSFGPQTRKKVRASFAFDLEMFAGVIPGTTVFVQPDGTEIPWTPACAEPAP